MRIVYLHQYFKLPNEMGGTRSYDLAKLFNLNGYFIDVISSTSSIEYRTKGKWSVIQIGGVTIHYIYLPYDNQMSYGKRIFVFFQFMYYATLKLLKIKCDVLLATSTPLTIGIPALFKKWFGGTPFVFEVRDVWPEAVIALGAVKNKLLQKVLYRLERIIYKNSAVIVPLSKDMKASIDKRYPEYRDKINYVIPNIAEINRFQKDGLKTDAIEKAIGFSPRFSVLYAGTFGRVNGVEYVVRLAKETLYIDKGLVYILVGSGAEKGNVHKLAKKEGVLNKNLFILEPVTKDELPDLYASSSMGSSFVIDIPELWANSANKFFDTLAASKPILINHEGWQADEIRKDQIGYVLPNTVTKESAKKFVEYTHNKELYIKQCHNALDKAKKDYSLDVAVGKYLEIFNSIER